MIAHREDVERRFRRRINAHVARTADDERRRMPLLHAMRFAEAERETARE